MASAHKSNAQFENLKLVIKNGHEMENLQVIDENQKPAEQSTGESFSHQRLAVNTPREEDVPNELSSSYVCNWQRSASVNIDNLLLAFDNDSDEFDKTWQMNYNEAAIYLEEGYNNDKLEHHPRSRDALPAYLIVHNRYFYILDLVASLILLTLALFENPSVPGFEVSPGFHASFELLALSVVSVELCMKLRWMKLKPFLSHTRTCIKMVTLIIMILEALVVLIRLDPHFRVTRALRPVFLIDNYYCGGIRRVIRQILQSLPPIFDMLLLLFFFMLIFALFGFYLFSSNPEDAFFESLERSFVSLFVLLTTANYPDIMMPSYAKCRWSALFFIAFLVIHLYFLMNLMLAVVYETFTRMDKEKFKKLLLHRRVACQHAFRLLVSRSNPTEISFKHFLGLMKYYKPTATKLEVYLMFKTLDTNKSYSLTIDEFHYIYEISELNWQQKKSPTFWFSNINVSFIRNCCNNLRIMVCHKWFEVFVNLVIACSFLWQLISCSAFALPQGTTRMQLFKESSIMLFFVIFSAVEALVKMIALGLIPYFLSFWNLFDFVVTSIALFGFFFNIFGVSVAFVFMLRSFRLLKLFQLKKRYRDIMGTFIFIVVKRFGSVAVVVLIVYYFFAIIGMEVFSGVDLKNCCKGTSVAQYFAAEDGHKNGYYYLNNFSNLATSFVTLFELMVVNNWFILMDGYAYLTSEWSRLYFMTFYIVTMVVITVVVAFVLDSFLFRIHYKRKMGESEEMLIANVALSKEEIAFATNSSNECPVVSSAIRFGADCDQPEQFLFRGFRVRSRFAFNLKMYAEEVKQWISEATAYEQTEESVGSQSTRSRRAISCSY